MTENQKANLHAEWIACRAALLLDGRSPFGGPNKNNPDITANWAGEVFHCFPLLTAYWDQWHYRHRTNLKGNGFAAMILNYEPPE